MKEMDLMIDSALERIELICTAIDYHMSTCTNKDCVSPMVKNDLLLPIKVCLTTLKGLPNNNNSISSFLVILVVLISADPHVYLPFIRDGFGVFKEAADEVVDIALGELGNVSSYSTH